MCKRPHLTKAERRIIQDLLDEGKMPAEIGERLGRDKSTIRKEINRHRKIEDENCVVVSEEEEFKKKCLLRTKKNVCNGCKYRATCSLPFRRVYRAEYAQEEYEEILTKSRTGARRSDEEIKRIADIVEPLIRNGQSPYQIVKNHSEQNICVKTLYNYIHAGYFPVRNIDLHRKVGRRTAKGERLCKKKRVSFSKLHGSQIENRSVYQGRTYDDFQRLSDQKAKAGCVQMDTLQSVKGCNKALLTFRFGEEKFFLAYLLERKTQEEVSRVFALIKKRLGRKGFKRMFPCILTDRGVEFGAPDSLETGSNGEKLTQIFFCDPGKCWQKGGVEQMHSLLREYLPKGKSFEKLTQKDVNRIVNNINSIPRKILDGETSYRKTKRNFGKAVLRRLGRKAIRPDDVVRRPWR